MRAARNGWPAGRSLINSAVHCGKTGVRSLRLSSIENAFYARGNLGCQNAVAMRSEVHAIGEVIIGVVFHR
jgi:hypothetical protein